MSFAAILKYLNNFKFLNVDIVKIHRVVGFGSGAVFGGYVLAHTALLNYYRDFLQFYVNGFTRPISPEISARIGQVASDMKLSTKYRAYLQPFYVPSFDPEHIGSFKMRTGAYIGIPANYNYKSTGDIERDLIMMKGKTVQWENENGELFQDSLILSENAQKFAIARELHHLDTNYVYFYGLISASTVYLQYLTTAYLNVKTFGHFKPKSFRYSMYTLVGFFTFGVWATTTDLLTKYYEEFTDSKASSLGINYAKGGVEFYTKLTRRNIATRELMGPDGEKLYTKYGNYNKEIFRQRHIPISIRKERAEKRVQAGLGLNNQNNEFIDNS